MKKVFFGFLCILCVFIYVAQADVIIMKTGEKMEGTIFDETEETVTVDIGAGKMTFYKSEIKSIEQGGQSRQIKTNTSSVSQTEDAIDESVAAAAPGVVKELMRLLSKARTDYMLLKNKRRDYRRKESEIERYERKVEQQEEKENEYLAKKNDVLAVDPDIAKKKKEEYQDKYEAARAKKEEMKKEFFDIKRTLSPAKDAIESAKQSFRKSYEKLVKEYKKIKKKHENDPDLKGIFARIESFLNSIAAEDRIEVYEGSGEEQGAMQTLDYFDEEKAESKMPIMPQSIDELKKMSVVDMLQAAQNAKARNEEQQQKVMQMQKMLEEGY